MNQTPRIKTGDLVVRLDHFDKWYNGSSAGAFAIALEGNQPSGDFKVEGCDHASFARVASSYWRKATPEEVLQYNLEQSQAKLKAAEEDVAKAQIAIKEAEEAKVFVEGTVYRLYGESGKDGLRILRKKDGAWHLFQTNGEYGYGNISAGSLARMYTPVTDFEAALKEVFANV